MPGPFFNEPSVARSHHLLVSWYENNQWTKPINYAKQNIELYQSTFNPNYLIDNRFERSIVDAVVRRHKKRKPVLNTREWQALLMFTHDKLVPEHVDSVNVTLVLEMHGKRDSVLFKHKIKLASNE